MFNRHPIYDRMAAYSYEAVERFLRSRPADHDPFATNAAVAMTATLAASANFVAVLERTMPRSLKKVSKDILALDTLAYVTCCVQQAVTHRRQQDRDGRLDAMWLHLTTTARILRTSFVEQASPALGAAWVERWREFREVEDPRERFHLLTYLLFTSKGHKVVLHRYPGAPPVLLDLTLGVEGATAELACLGALGEAVDAFLHLGALMPDDPLEEEEDGDI